MKLHVIVPGGVLLGTSLILAAAAQQPADGCADARAGCAQRIAWWACPSDTGRYVGYYVGGGNPWRHFGDPPASCDGTWGWDYWGGCFKRNVILGWWHGRRYQGGLGAYKTEGPHILPSVETHYEEPGAPGH